ncbi:protein of unknown function [Burkholderia multivorans]
MDSTGFTFTVAMEAIRLYQFV